MTREQFKYLAAGKFCYGKGSQDSKQLEIYVEGALMAWDYLNIRTKEVQNGNEKREEASSRPELPGN